MTLNKQGIRYHLDLWLDEFGDSQRFEIEDSSLFNVIPQDGRHRIPHNKQKSLNYMGFGENEI